MKKVLLSLTSMLIMCIAVAQDHQRPSLQEHLKLSQEMMQKELKLNESQQKQMEQIFKDFMEQAKKIHDENPPPPPPPIDPVVKASLDKLKADRDTKVKKILTDDQYLKYQEVEKKMRVPNPPPPPHLPPPPPGNN